MKTIKRNGKETVLINPCDIRYQRKGRKILIGICIVGFFSTLFLKQ